MDTLTRDDLQELINATASPCVSLYMPLRRTGQSQQQNRIQFKNLLQQTEQRLSDAGMRATDSKQILQRAESLRGDDMFWRKLSDGLTMFTANELFRCYKLPLTFEPQVVVCERFFIKPLLPLLRDDRRFFILAVTQDTARLFDATRYSISERELPEIAHPDIDGPDETLQYHSHSAPTMGKGQTAEAIYHGHGGADDRGKTDILKYFQNVDRAVGRALRGQREPLVLACVGYLAPIYASANSYPRLIRPKVPGNPDSWTMDELRDRAWHLAQPQLRQRETQALDALRQAQGTGRASGDLREVVLAADQGRVESLFVASDEHKWGRVESSLQAVHVLSEEDEQSHELLDFAAARTLANGGDVFALPRESMPTDSPLAAVFRFTAPSPPADSSEREQTMEYQSANGEATM